MIFTFRYSLSLSTTNYRILFINDHRNDMMGHRSMAHSILYVLKSTESFL